jgi:chemotaxis protein CheX
MPQSAIDPQPGNTTPTLRIGPDEVARMANDLFNAMLGMRFNPDPQDASGIAPVDVQASIRISGDWNAECHVLASDELATRIAEGMFGSEAGDLTEAEILDAMGEVVNVIGGNAKGMVDLDCNLSLPCVGRAVRDQPESALALDFDCDGLPLTIVMIEE